MKTEVTIKGTVERDEAGLKRLREATSDEACQILIEEGENMTSDFREVPEGEAPR